MPVKISGSQGLMLCESALGVRLLGQRQGQLGPLHAEITVYEKDGLPNIILRLHNATEQDVWWAGSSSNTQRQGGNWTYAFADGGYGGRGGTGTSCRSGQSKQDRPPTEEELATWRFPPGSSRFVWFSPPSHLLYADANPQQRREFLRWGTQFQVKKPVLVKPTRYNPPWKTVNVMIYTNHAIHETSILVMPK